MINYPQKQLNFLQFTHINIFLINYKKMVIKLYLDYASQPSRAVWAFMLLNKIPHELVEIRISKGETRSEQFAKINPMKKVPAIVDTDNGNFTLVESHAIMRYLSRQYPCEQMWYPKQDNKRAAKIDEYLDYHHTGIRKCSYLIFNTLFAKAFNREDPSFNPEKALKQVEFNLKYLDGILSTSGYIVGEYPSLADLAAFYELEFLILLDYNFEKWSNLNRWMKYMKGIKEVNVANQKFYVFAQKIKQVKAKL